MSLEGKNDMIDKPVHVDNVLMRWVRNSVKVRLGLESTVIHG